jgi:hypothetical protein
MLEIEDRLMGKAFPLMERSHQVSVYACGPATLEMLFSFVGVRVSQTSMIRSIRAQNKIKAYGIDVKDMAKATNIKGKKAFSFWKKEYANVSDLDAIVNKYKYPVGVEWQGVFYENEDEDSGHYGVITKIDKKSGLLRIADPYFNAYFDFEGVDRKFKISEFKKKWWDENEVKVAGSTKTRMIKDIRMMFLITPTGATWPKKLGVVKK